MLRDVDVAIPAGSHIAIVGETGSGKTTFTKLLTRLADPTEGGIEVGGIDLREVAPSPATAIRMVPQDGFLFDWSVRENVKAGRDGATDRESTRRSRSSAWPSGRAPFRTDSRREPASAGSSSRWENDS